MGIGISQQGLAPCVFAGAVAIALWTVVRFPRLAPKSITTACLHVVTAYVGGLALAGALIGFFASLPIPGAFELAVVAGALPPSVYLFASIAWFIRSLQGLLAMSR
jgi:hypothetical protein